MAELTRRSKQDSPYPDTSLAQKLALMARLLKGGFAARVFYAVQPGYDMHAAQGPLHGSLLSELSGALLAFLDDLGRAKLADRVAVLCFSEFGRRVAESGSAGTDHGTAAPVFLAGPGVKSGLVGSAPSLCDLADGDIKESIDFRRVYASVLEGWLGLPSEAALGGSFEPLSLFRVT
jgi:uncharacterized protein (DUF1501 family)